MPSILLIHPKDEPIDDIVAQVRKIAPAYKVATAVRGAPLDESKFDDVEIIAGNGLPKGLKNNKSLQWYHHNAAGVDWIFEYDSPRNIRFQITNISGLHAVQITEHVFGLIHTLNRDMMNFHVSKEKRQWQKPRKLQLETLPGKTILIVGLGHIGSRIAKIAKAHDMNVLAIRRHLDKESANVDEVGTFRDLHDYLSRADITVSVLPNTPETHGIFSAKAFEKVKPNSLFINVGRGSHVDEAALVRSLDEGKLRGAGLDVFQNEPLPIESILWSTQNLIISPHCSGQVQDYTRLAYHYFLNNLKRYLNGQVLENRIDTTLGY